MVREAGRLLENSGWQSIWVPDSRFARDPFVSLSVLAVSTKRVRLGIAAVDPFCRSIPLVGMAMASLGELAGSRLDIAIGAGSSGLDELGIRVARPVKAVQNEVGVLRDLLSGGARALAPELPPIHLECPPAAVCLWVATRSPAMLRMAAAHADGVVVGHVIGDQALTRIATEIQKGLRKRRGDLQPFRRLLRVQVVVGKNKETINSAARRTVAWVLRQHRSDFTWLEELGLQVNSALANAVQTLSSPRQVEDLAELIPDNLVDSLVIRARSPLDVAERLCELERSGELMVRFDVQSEEDPVSALHALISRL